MTARTASIVGQDAFTAIVDTDLPNTADQQVCIFPASLEQSRYWILDQLEGGSTASNMAIAVHLEGEVDDAILDQSLRELTRRHEALRTNFRMVDGELSQVISDEPRFSLSVSDLRSLPPTEAKERAEAIILDHGRVRIDLAYGPVFFAHLIHVTDRHHFLAFTLHHITCDGWSNGILVRDFTAIYAALKDERSISLPELPFQFADFTIWQKEWLDSEAASTALGFWRKHIGRDMPAIDLPTDHPRSAQKSAPGHIESQLLSPSLTAKLKTYCRQHDATMHQVLLASFEGLISRYTGQTEFLLGSTIANRTQPGMEHVVGRFANPQVVFADLRGNPTYAELLARVADWSAKSYAHQNLPFSRLMEEFQLDQSGATSQFLQVYFVYQKAFMQPQQSGDLKVIPRPSVSGGVNFDLLVSVVERAEGPRLQIEYNTILFERQRIRRLIEMYIRTLEAVVDHDTIKVSELPLLSEQQAADSGTPGLSSAPLPSRAASIPEWLDGLGEERGEQLAILEADRRLSWRDLIAKSKDFAQGLRQLGVTSGETVALCMEPTAAAAAAAIATLRLGAVVLPVPQTATVSDWNLIRLENRPHLCLASQELTAKLSTIVSFEHLENLARGSSSLSSPLPYPAESNHAWLYLRTDSDGRYRVMPVTHESALQSMLGAVRILDMRPGDRVLFLPSQSAAEAWTDILLPLTAGASIVHAANPSPQQFQSLLDREQVAFAFATPVEFAALAAQGWKSDRRLHLVCRGPRTTAANLERLVQNPGRIDVLYSSPLTSGPFAVGRFDRSTNSACPILPLPGRQLVVLDHFGNLQPSGVDGELALRQGASIIRSGYLARFSSERGVEIIDSADRLVRLHSYRLKLRDIENFLYRDSHVAFVETVAVRDSAGTSHLAAYVVGQMGKRPSTQALSNLLRSSAPAHFSIAEIIAVDSIPRRADGTANLSALPRPSTSRTMDSTAVELVPPRDELERKLVKIWEESLGITGIGVRNSFFSLGGYSLMIVRLFARINKAFGTALPITTIFNAPTIEQLAEILRGRSIYSALVPVQTGGSKPPVFIVHSYLIYEGLRKVLGEDRPFYGLRELERDEGLSVEDRAAAYVRQIRSVQASGPYHLGGWCAAGPLAIETARQLAELGETVAMVVLFDSWRPGYAAEFASAQADNPKMAKSAVLRRKYLYHRMKLAPLSAHDKLKYSWEAVANKLRSSRDRLYLHHWGLAERFFKAFGMPLPHFMHNVSLKTIHSVREFKGRPFPGRITLIRATETPYLPGADPACGWNDLAQGGVDVLFAPGTHKTMFLEPNLSVLGEALRDCFERAAAQTQSVQ